MAYYKALLNPYTGQLQLTPTNIILNFKEAVATAASLPLTGNSKGDARLTNDTGYLYVWVIESSSGLITDWTNAGDVINITWAAISDKPSSSVADIDDAVNKRHTQNTDQYLDFGGLKQASASDVYDAVSKKHSNSLDHTQGTDQGLDTGGLNASTAADVKDAVDKKHSNSLDHTQNSDTYLAKDTVNEVTAANAKLAVDHKDLTNNPHNVTQTQVGLGNVDNKSETTIITDVKADSDVASAISLKHIQGTDQGLDTGGLNASTAANVKSAVDLKHTQNSDTYLATQVTKTLYVDNGRIDTYTENGSITKPFKTIAAALAQIVTNGDNGTFRYFVNIAGGYYAEEIALTATLLCNVCFIGDGHTVLLPVGGKSVTITAGDITHSNSWFFDNMAFGGIVNITGYVGYCDVRFYGCNTSSDIILTTLSSVIIDSLQQTTTSKKIDLINCVNAYLKANVGVNLNPSITDALPIATGVVTSNINILGSRFSAKLTPAVTGARTLIINCTGTNFSSTTSTTIPVGAILSLENSSFKCALVNNGVIALVGGSGTSHATGITGTAALLLTYDKTIANTSSVTGTSVKDALDTLKTNALDKAHTQGTDVTLGAMSADINANSHQVTGLSIPDAAGEAIRQTTKITEVNLEDAVDKKHSNSLDHTQGTDQGLDTGGLNASTAANVKDAVDKKHSNSLDHTQGTDTGLDTGGANPITAAALVILKDTTVPGKEPALGNPGVDGYVLSSTMAGARSWIAPGGGSGLRTVVDKTDTYNVLTTDVGKVLTMNNTLAKIFNLPSVAAGDVGTYFTFVKLGTGTVTIDAADSDIIADSGAGDTIYNNQITETYATITLLLVSATLWVIVDAHGTWVTTD